MSRAAARLGTCATCGGSIRAGARGPLPTRCRRCRHPVLPERAKRRVPCRDCGRPLPVGRRGPLPTRCDPCRRPRAAARAAGTSACSKCGHPVPVTRATGRLPRTCWWCRRGRRRLSDLSEVDWEMLRAARADQGCAGRQ